MVHQQLVPSEGEGVLMISFVRSKLVYWYCSGLWYAASNNPWAKEFAYWIQSSHPASNLIQKWFTGNIVFCLGAEIQANCSHCRNAAFFTYVWSDLNISFHNLCWVRMLYHLLSQRIALQEYGTCNVKLDKPWKAQS